MPVAEVRGSQLVPGINGSQQDLFEDSQWGPNGVGCLWFLSTATLGHALLVGSAPASTRASTCQALIQTNSGLAGVLKVSPGLMNQAMEIHALEQLVFGLEALLDGRSAEGLRWADVDPTWLELVSDPDKAFGLAQLFNSEAFLRSVEFTYGSVEIGRPDAWRLAYEAAKASLRSAIASSLGRFLPPPGPARQVPIGAASALLRRAGKQGGNAVHWARQAIQGSVPAALIVLAFGPQGNRVAEAICAGASLYEAFQCDWQGWVLRRWLRIGHRLPVWSQGEISLLLELTAQLDGRRGPRSTEEWQALLRAGIQVRYLLGPEFASGRLAAELFSRAASIPGGWKDRAGVEVLWAFVALVEALPCSSYQRKTILRSAREELSVEDICAAAKAAERVLAKGAERALLSAMSGMLGLVVDEIVQLGRELLPTRKIGDWLWRAPSNAAELLTAARRSAWCIQDREVLLSYLLNGRVFVLGLEASSCHRQALLAMELPTYGEQFRVVEIAGSRNRPASSGCRASCDAYPTDITGNCDGDSKLEVLASAIADLRDRVREEKLRRLRESAVWNRLLKDVR